MDFNMDDAWTLLSICASGRKGGNLRTIIMVADYINHSIPNHGELFASMRKLHKAGLITQKDDLFMPTRRMDLAYSKIRKLKKTYLKEWDDIEAFLKGYKVPSRPPATRLRGLTKKAFEKAVKDHLNRR